MAQLMGNQATRPCNWGIRPPGPVIEELGHQAHVLRSPGHQAHVLRSPGHQASVNAMRPPCLCQRYAATVPSSAMRLPYPVVLCGCRTQYSYAAAVPSTAMRLPH